MKTSRSIARREQSGRDCNGNRKSSHLILGIVSMHLRNVYVTVQISHCKYDGILQ